MKAFPLYGIEFLHKRELCAPFKYILALIHFRVKGNEPKFNEASFPA